MADANATNLATARAAWGKAAPEWVIALAAACDAVGATQKSIGKKIGCSDSLVNQVLRNKYVGRLDKVEAKVRGALMNKRVTCPVLGDITTKRCIDEQTRPYQPTNEVRVELRRACPVCPNRLEKEGA